MSNFLKRLVEETPPAHVFEISKAGIAYSNDGQIGFRPFEEDVLNVTPARDNIQKPLEFNAHVGAIIPKTGKRRPAALILPDFAARVQVLDFDKFPSDPTEQMALIKFRVRKTVPFDVESAVVSYQAQPSGKRVDVAAAVIALEIVARYEAPFRAAGLQPGMVTTSSLAALNLTPSSGVLIIVKLSGHTMNVMVQDGSRLRLARTVELEHIDFDDLLAVLYPTIAYIEDEMSTRPEKLYLIGHPSIASDLSRELELPVEPVESRYGTPGEYNAGLFGYLQGGPSH